jgi:hypothetical protein
MKLSDDRGFDSYIDRDHHQHNHQHQLLAGSELSNELTVSYQDDVPIAEQPRRGVREELAWLVLFEMSCALKYIHERGIYLSIYLCTVASYATRKACLVCIMFISCGVYNYPTIYLFIYLFIYPSIYSFIAMSSICRTSTSRPSACKYLPHHLRWLSRQHGR